MRIELEKGIALYQATEDDTNWFSMEIDGEDKAFSGYSSEDEALEAYEADNSEDKPEDFGEWVIGSCPEIEEYNENDYNRNYDVYTDDEANARWEEELDSYLEECIYPELQGNLKNYFDEEAWKRDARFDGRGHSISKYDGNETECNINGTWYYVYRQN